MGKPSHKSSRPARKVNAANTYTEMLRQMTHSIDNTTVAKNPSDNCPIPSRQIPNQKGVKTIEVNSSATVEEKDKTIITDQKDTTNSKAPTVHPVDKMDNRLRILEKKYIKMVPSNNTDLETKEKQFEKRMLQRIDDMIQNKYKDDKNKINTVNDQKVTNNSNEGGKICKQLTTEDVSQMIDLRLDKFSQEQDTKWETRSSILAKEIISSTSTLLQQFQENINYSMGREQKEKEKPISEVTPIKNKKTVTSNSPFRKINQLFTQPTLTYNTSIGSREAESRE